MHGSLESITISLPRVYDAAMRVAVLLVVLAWCASAFAQQQPLEVSFAADADCGSREQFEQGVLERLNVERLEASESAQRVSVELRRQGAAVVGRVLLAAGNGRESTREIAAASCDEAIDGLALITAVALQREREAPPATITAPSKPAPRPRPMQRPLPTATLAFELVSSGLFASGTLPEPALGLELAAGLRASIAGAEGSLRLGLRLAPDQSATVSTGTAAFEWTSAIIDVCPRWFVVSAAVALAPCAVTEVGVLEASGARTANPRSERRLWLAPGAGLIGSFRFASPLALELGTEALFPLVHDRFLLGAEVAHQVPRVAARARLGLGVRFP
jgi:hypothetical protein